MKRADVPRPTGSAPVTGNPKILLVNEGTVHYIIYAQRRAHPSAFPRCFLKCRTEPFKAVSAYFIENLQKEKIMELTEVFGSNVFNDKVMKERLPKQIYKALKETIEKELKSNNKS